MRIINAFDGQEYHVGDTFPDPVVSRGRILDVEDRFFSARVLVEWPDGARWSPLGVRFTHPKYFGRRVAFILT